MQTVVSLVSVRAHVTVPGGESRQSRIKARAYLKTKIGSGRTAVDVHRIDVGEVMGTLLVGTVEREPRASLRAADIVVVFDGETKSACDTNTRGPSAIEDIVTNVDGTRAIVATTSCVQPK